MTLSGSYTGTLKRNALRSVAGAPLASSGGKFGVSEPCATSRSATRAAAAAIPGSSNSECSRKAFRKVASCAGTVHSKHSVAGARASQVMLKINGRGSVAESGIAANKALPTCPVRASAAGACMASGVRPSMAGAMSRVQGDGQRRAWH